MSNSSQPQNRGSSVADSATRLLDDADVATLAALAETFDAVDPPPEGLADRLKFGVALDEIFTEVAQLTRLATDPMAVRGDAGAATRTETMTFSAETLTAMVTVTRISSDRLRLDGWIAPETQMRIRLRMQGERRQTSSDETGRFSFDNLPNGFAQLMFTGEGDSGALVATPLFEL